VSLGRRYKHEWRTTNPSEMERTATDGEGWRRWWPDGGTASMVQGSVSEVLWQEEENGKMIDNSIWRRGARGVELTEARWSTATNPVVAAVLQRSAVDEK
jgi:hypothetical protein